MWVAGGVHRCIGLPEASADQGDEMDAQAQDRADTPIAVMAWKARISSSTAVKCCATITDVMHPAKTGTGAAFCAHPWQIQYRRALPDRSAPGADWKYKAAPAFALQTFSPGEPRRHWLCDKPHREYCAGYVRSFGGPPKGRFFGVFRWRVRPLGCVYVRVLFGY